MRNEFLHELERQATKNDKVFLVVGDLGYGVVDSFADRLPKQFLNAGVAEQSMIGISAGLAMSGYRPYVYSIANFPTFRALEQIRNDLCYDKKPVTIVSVGVGLAYGTLGYTHHAVEDISIMRSLPIRVISPADLNEAISALRYCLNADEPIYVRLGKSGEPQIHDAPPKSIVSGLFVRTGSDAVIAATGAIVAECISAADLLLTIGISVSVVSCPTIKPLDASWLVGMPQQQKLFTVEEHMLPGGFGSAVLEVVNDLDLDIKVSRLGLRTEFIAKLGSQQYLREIHGIDSQSIFTYIRNSLSNEI